MFNRLFGKPKPLDDQLLANEDPTSGLSVFEAPKKPSRLAKLFFCCLPKDDAVSNKKTAPTPASPSKKS
jgi:hypothetical protein